MTVKLSKVMLPVGYPSHKEKVIKSNIKLLIQSASKILFLNFSKFKC